MAMKDLAVVGIAVGALALLSGLMSRGDSVLSGVTMPFNSGDHVPIELGGDDRAPTQGADRRVTSGGTAAPNQGTNSTSNRGQAGRVGLIDLDPIQDSDAAGFEGTATFRDMAGNLDTVGIDAPGGSTVSGSNQGMIGGVLRG